MGTVHRLPAAAESVTPQEAVRAYLATISHAESGGTRRVYGAVLHRFAGCFAGAADVDELDGAEVTEWFTGQWARTSSPRVASATLSRFALRRGKSYGTVRRSV